MIPEAIMNNAMSFYPLFTALYEIQNYFINHVLAWTMLAQLMVVAAAYALAYGAARKVRPRLHNQLNRHPAVEHSLGHVARVIATRLVTPLIAIVILWLAYGMAFRFNWPRHGLRTALGLLLAWVSIRLLTGRMKNRTLARIISFTIWCIAALDILHLLIPVLNLLDSIDFVIVNVRLSVLAIIRGLLILGVLFWLAKKVSMLFEHWITTVPNVTASVQVLLNKLLSLALFTVVIVGVLAFMGINLTAFAVFSGAIGLGIGFGLQKVFANLISGLIILADKSIKPGDVIQVGDTYGWINYLGGRYVSVVTRDATEYLIPNEDLITTQVINWSHSNNLVRLKIPIGVCYGCDLAQAMDLMLAAAADEPRVLTDPEPVCLLIGFGDSSVNFQLRVWIRDPQNGVTNVKSQVLLGVWKRFHQHGIELPFPQRVLHHKSMPELEVAVRPRTAAADPGIDLLQPV